MKAMVVTVKPPIFAYRFYPRSVSNLEAAISTLETEFEACEVVKVDTSALQSGKCADETVLLVQLKFKRFTIGGYMNFSHVPFTVCTM
jgi:hypothetical protein